MNRGIKPQPLQVKSIPGRSPRRRGTTWGDDHAARFSRRLNSILRDSISVFKRVLAGELKTARPTGDYSEGHIVFRVATWFIVGLCRLLIIKDWLNFLAERPDLTRSQKTRLFLTAMRRRGIRRSEASLHKHRLLFIEGGLVALLPHYRGGRPCRIPPADRELIERLSRTFRRDRGLSGTPMNRRKVERTMRECLDQLAVDQPRRRSNRSSVTSQEPRIAFIRSRSSEGKARRQSLNHSEGVA